MTGNPRQPDLPPAVRRKLRRLRWRIRAYVLQLGLNSVLLWLALAFWASLGIDWLFEPPVAVRRAMLWIAAAVLLGVLFRTVIRRLFVRMSDRNMAMLVERRFPEFDEGLLTAVELSDGGDDLGPHCREMLARTCRRVEEPLRRVRLRRVLNVGPLRLSAAAVVVLDLAIAMFAFQAPDAVEVWMRRDLFLLDELWPRSTRLAVEGFPGGVTKVARGDDLEVIVLADLRKPVVPGTVEVRWRTEGGARLRATMRREGQADPTADRYQEYSYTFRGVLEPVRFDVVGGDDAVRDLSIEVVDSPTLVEVSLECRFPDYMDRPPRTLPVTGVMQLPLGTRITVLATANKDLVEVEVDDGREVSTIRPGRKPAAAGHVPDEAAVVPDEAGGVPEQAEPAAGVFRRFAYRLPVFTEDLTLRFKLLDTDGIQSREPVRLALATVADQAPELSVELRGIGSAITPQARLPAAGQVTDDHGIARVWFDYTIDQREPVAQPIDSPPGNVTDFKLDHALEVERLGLSPGQKLLVAVKAADRCDLAGDPNVGTSQRWLLDVVTPAQLRTMLEARELVLRQRFERIVQEVTETRDLVERMEFGSPPPAREGNANEATGADEVREGEKEEQEDGDAQAPGDKPPDKPGDQEQLTPERALSLRTLRVERAVQSSRKNAQETLGVADAFGGIRAELVNNGIDTPELKARLQDGVADPLRRIAETAFPELDRRLDRLEATLADGQAGPENRRLAVAQLDAILAAMQEVLDRMLELEDFNKVVELLREIVHAEERLSEQTRERHKQKLQDLLEK